MTGGDVMKEKVKIIDATKEDISEVAFFSKEFDLSVPEKKRDKY